jgi:hypothetical protein
VRNTDNAWVETTIYHYHDEDGIAFNPLPLINAGDDVDISWRTFCRDKAPRDITLEMMMKVGNFTSLFSARLISLFTHTTVAMLHLFFFFIIISPFGCSASH